MFSGYSFLVAFCFFYFMDGIYFHFSICFGLFLPCTHFSQMTGSSWLSFHTYSVAGKTCFGISACCRTGHREGFTVKLVEVWLFCVKSSYVSISGSFLLAGLCFWRRAVGGVSIWLPQFWGSVLAGKSGWVGFLACYLCYSFKFPCFQPLPHPSLRCVWYFFLFLIFPENKATCMLSRFFRKTPVLLLHIFFTCT